MAGFIPRWPGAMDLKGRIHVDNRPAFDAWCANFAGKRIEVRVMELEKRRTLAQNRAWFGLALKTLSEWNGDETETWHKRLKRQFGIKSTARLTVAEFEELREKTIRWAAQAHGVVIPDPNEVSL